MATKSKNFENGAFVVSRSIFESEIWFKSPEYLKIWIYLFGKANHKTRKTKGYVCERGQYFCDYQELLEQLEYKIGYRKKKYNESFMKNLMKYLRDSLMIATTKKPRGLLVTIYNYEHYQPLENYEKTSEKTSEKTATKPALNQTPLSINKNVKNEEELKEEDIKPPIAPQGEINFIEKYFKEFISIYPNGVEKSEAWTAWQQLFVKGFSGPGCKTKFFAPLTEDLFNEIITAVKNQITYRKEMDRVKKWYPEWKQPGPWLRSRRWEDDVKVEKKLTLDDI